MSPETEAGRRVAAIWCRDADIAHGQVTHAEDRPCSSHAHDVAQVEAEAAQRALDDVRAKVEALPIQKHLDNWGSWIAHLDRTAVLATLPSEPVSTEGETER